jgi:hypothetical protein
VLVDHHTLRVKDDARLRARRARVVVELQKLASEATQMVTDLIDLGEAKASDAAGRRQALALAAVALIESTATLAEHISTKVWAGTTENAFASIRDTAKFARAAINEDYPAAAALGVAFLQREISNKCKTPEEENADTQACKWAKGVVKTVPLIVEVATAENGKDVAATLEAAVDPLGSYRSKYQRDTITLGAMLGFAGGWEGLPRQDVTGSTSGTFGVFAPVGLHLARPYEIEGTKYHYGLLLSVLDLGALASFRLENELKPVSETETAEAATEPNVSFEQIFSPGGLPGRWTGRLPVCLWWWNLCCSRAPKRHVRRERRRRHHDVRKRRSTLPAVPRGRRPAVRVLNLADGARRPPVPDRRLPAQRSSTSHARPRRWADCQSD